MHLGSVGVNTRANEPGNPVGTGDDPVDPVGTGADAVAGPVCGDYDRNCRR